MADSKREIERKYEATPETRLPDLTRAAGVSAVEHRGLTELDAVYYDTADLRLAAGSLTLRRRTGGDDAGWHLKFPVSTGIRDEIRAPLADTLPDDLAGLIRSRVRDAEVAPVMRLRSARDVCHLLDGKGVLLAELSTDEVHAERLTEDGCGSTAAWTEIEVELADDRDPAVLDAVERRLRKAGVRPAASPSKLARALAETAPEKPRRTKEPASRAPRATTCSPTSATRSRRSSTSTPPCAAVCPIPCTACGSPPAGCAVPSRRTARSSTAPSPIRSAPS